MFQAKRAFNRSPEILKVRIVESLINRYNEKVQENMCDKFQKLERITTF